MYSFDNIQEREVLFYAYTMCYFGRLRAFHKELFYTLVESLMESSTFVNSLYFSRFLNAVSLALTPLRFIFIFLNKKTNHISLTHTPIRYWIPQLYGTCGLYISSYLIEMICLQAGFNEKIVHNVDISDNCCYRFKKIGRI